MITQQERYAYENTRSSCMIVAHTVFSKNDKLIHVKVYIDNSDRQISITPFELKSWLEQCYHDGSLKLTDDLDDELYFLCMSRFHNRDYMFEITQDGDTGYVIKYPSFNY